jgi:hypothetical protein
VTATTSPLTTWRNQLVANGNERGERRCRVVGAGSVRLRLGHRVAGGLVVTKGTAVGISGNKGLAGQVVDRSAQAPAGLVDPGYSVVGEQGLSFDHRGGFSAPCSSSN